MRVHHRYADSVREHWRATGVMLADSYLRHIEAGLPVPDSAKFRIQQMRTLYPTVKNGVLLGFVREAFRDRLKELS